MTKSAFVKFSIFFLFIISVWISNLEMSIELPPPTYLIEERAIDLIFIGIDSDSILEEDLIDVFNHSYTSEYPYGSILSKMILTPSIKTIDSTIRNQLISSLYSYSSNRNKSSDYFIHYTDFVTTIQSNVLPASSELTTFKIVILNVMFPDSLFGNSSLYINYSTQDHDTQKKSQLRPYSDHGVTFSLKNDPVLGIITSSDPPFPCPQYPSFRKYLTGEITKDQWNECLREAIEQAIWCRINPSPVFRYQSHKTVNLYIALIGMDQKVSLTDMLQLLNTTMIQQEVNDLVMISEVSVATLLVQAPEPFREITGEKGERYSLWATKIEQYLKNHAASFWGRDYFVEETNDYNTELNLYIAVMYGRGKILPWSVDNAGLTHFATNTSELAGLAVITMNYQNIFNNSEGLTLTTLHEIGHLFGLIHAHDYWNPTTSQMEDTWIWGYTATPMTYFLTNYNFDFFDHLIVWRMQVDSLLTSMNEYEYESKAIDKIYSEIRKGAYQSLEDELLKIKAIYLRYKDRENFHILFTRLIILGGCVLIFMVLVGTVRWYRRKMT